jgi:hypothetical protein
MQSPPARRHSSAVEQAAEAVLHELFSPGSPAGPETARLTWSRQVCVDRLRAQTSSTAVARCLAGKHVKSLHIVNGTRTQPLAAARMECIKAAFILDLIHMRNQIGSGRCSPGRLTNGC